jgi:hypothetical protein
VAGRLSNQIGMGNTSFKFIHLLIPKFPSLYLSVMTQGTMIISYELI